MPSVVPCATRENLINSCNQRYRLNAIAIKEHEEIEDNINSYSNSTLFS